MRHNFEPSLHPVALSALRPTQMTVGMKEVMRKRAEWRERRERDGSDFLGRHIVPVVLGPRGRYYLLDHHHLVRALLDEGVERVLVGRVEDLRLLPPEGFWTFMDNRNWLHPFDADGKRRDYAELPKSVEGLVDDAYRSLAGAVRRSGGYAKDYTPYAEFLWADFFRTRIGARGMRADFERALRRALELARSPDSRYLPGWCGPSD